MCFGRLWVRLVLGMNSHCFVLGKVSLIIILVFVAAIIITTTTTSIRISISIIIIITITITIIITITTTTTTTTTTIIIIMIMIMIVETLQGHVHEQLLFAWLSVHHFGVGPFPRLTSQGFSHTQTIWMQPWLRWMEVAQRWLGKTQGMTDWWLIA